MSDQRYLEEMKKAIEMEINGQKFYLEMEGKTKNALAKKVFSSLAKDEQDHTNAIKKFSENILGNNDLPDMGTVITRDHKQGDESVFGVSPRQLGQKAGLEDSDIGGYRIAMQMERDGYNFYKECRDRASDEKIKKLFQFLIEEESAHYQALDESYEYLTHPDDWFAREERPIFEG